jgi:hypothetical protein
VPSIFPTGRAFRLSFLNCSAFGAAVIIPGRGWSAWWWRGMRPVAKGARGEGDRGCFNTLHLFEA